MRATRLDYNKMSTLRPASAVIRYEVIKSELILLVYKKRAYALAPAEAIWLLTYMLEP